MEDGAGPPDEAASKHFQTLPSRAEAERHRLRVLVVEDDDLVRRQVEQSLRLLGHEVRSASGGVEALRMLASEPGCDLLLTDVVMPGMGGGELARLARVLQPDLPIVFVSGYHADPLVTEMQGAARVRLLTKPYRRQALVEALLVAAGSD